MIGPTTDRKACTCDASIIRTVFINHPEQAYEKAVALLRAGCQFSEFGTRRRRSYRVQDLVVATLIRADNENPGKGKLVGTSNV